MGKRLYVGNLAHDVDSATIEGIFKAHGTVESAEVVTDPDTGRSRGFGFVEMSTEAEAQAAMAALSGADCAGRPLAVNEAKPRESRIRVGGRSGGGRSGGRNSGGGGRGRR